MLEYSEVREELSRVSDEESAVELLEKIVADKSFIEGTEYPEAKYYFDAVAAVMESVPYVRDAFREGNPYKAICAAMISALNYE